MLNQYFLKFISDPNNKTARQTIVDESVDVLGLRSIRLGGIVFDETNIVTVSGTNSLESVSGDLTDLILSVSGASSLRNDSQDLDLISVSGDLTDLILSVSGASSLRDDSQDLDLISVSSSLQSQLDAITSDLPREERFFVSGGQSLIDVTTFTFDPTVTVKDIKVYKNGRVLFQSSSGGEPGEKTGGDFVKTSDTQLSLFVPGKDGDRYVIRDERTGGGGGGGGSTDLENIIVNTKPLTNGAVSLGGIGKGWQSLFLNDVTNSDVYEMQISGGVLQAILV